MDINHETLVAISKSYGLFYMMIFFFIVVLYACWPSNKKKFDKAANSIFTEKDD